MELDRPYVSCGVMVGRHRLSRCDYIAFEDSDLEIRQKAQSFYKGTDESFRRGGKELDRGGLLRNVGARRLEGPRLR